MPNCSMWIEDQLNLSTIAPVTANQRINVDFWNIKIQNSVPVYEKNGWIKVYRNGDRNEDGKPEKDREKNERIVFTRISVYFINSTR